MASENDKAVIDYKAILTGIITSAIVSGATFAWFMGGLDNRVKNLEQGSSKIDVVVDKVNLISNQLAVLNTDLTYVKENMRDLKANSTALSTDVSNLRNQVTTLQNEDRRNDKQ